MEDAFIDLAFEQGDVQGMTPDDIKQYIRFIADWRLRQLALPEVYGVKENPLPWLQSLLSGVEHANFFGANGTARKACGRASRPCCRSAPRTPCRRNRTATRSRDKRG
jgi:ribonucleotide reductase beta subunit family protein with ferritin-like domain